MIIQSGPSGEAADRMAEVIYHPVRPYAPAGNREYELMSSK